MRNSSRLAFTLVELLIVIAIIGTLMALLLPAINAARERARQATCTNNQKEISKAILSFATSNDRFPGWAEDQKLLDGSTIPISWAAKILSELDQKGLWEQLLQTPNTVINDPPKQELFLCPSDARTNPRAGGMTYVVNSGMPDVNSIPSDSKANGICHDLRNGRGGPKVKLGSSTIKDGAGTTLLMAENVHKDDGITWLGPIGALTNPEQGFGMVWVYDQGTAPGQPPATMFDLLNKDTRANQSGAYAAEGTRFMRPASAHPEMFIAAFCDASVKPIRDSIDYRVYQQLMTPNGARAVDLASGDNMSGFMNPPLSDADFK